MKTDSALSEFTMESGSQRAASGEQQQQHQGTR